MPKLTLEDLLSAYPEEVQKILESRKNSSFVDEGDFIKKQLESKGLVSELTKQASDPVKYAKQLQNLTPEQAETFAKSRQAKVDQIIQNYKLDQLLNKDRSEIAKDLVQDWNRFGEGSPDPQAELDKELAGQPGKKTKSSIFDSPSEKLERELRRREIVRGSKGYINPNSPVIRAMDTPETTKQFQSEMGVKDYTPRRFETNPVGKFTAVGGPRKYSWPPVEVMGEGQSGKSSVIEEPLEAEWREILKNLENKSVAKEVSPEQVGGAGAAAAGASKFAELLKNPKVAALFGFGKNIAMPAAALYEAEKAREAFQNKDYRQAGLHGLSAAGAASVAIPNPASSFLIPAGTIAGVEAHFPQVSQGVADTLYKMLPESMKTQVTVPTRYKDQAPDSEEISELEDLFKKTYQDAQEEPSPEVSEELETTPEATTKPTVEPMSEPGLEVAPEPTPSPEPSPEKPSASIGSKLLDILGMPSAYAEEMPKEQQRVPASVAPDKRKRDINKAKNLAYITAKKMGVSPILPLAVIPHESSWNLDSSKESELGESVEKTGLGTMQITPGTVADLITRHKKLGIDIGYLNGKIRYNPKKIAAGDFSEIQEDIKKLSPEDNLMTGAAIFKLKAKDYNLDPNNPEDFPKLIRLYNGEGPKTIEYLKKVMPHLKQAIKDVSSYEKSIQDEKDFNKKLQLETPFIDRKGMNLSKTKRSLPFGQSIDVVPMAMEQPAEETLSESEKDPDQILADVENSVEEEIKDKSGKDLSSLDLVGELQKEASDDKMMKLMAMQNLLQTQAMTPLLKGMALAASGIVGAGPKKPFVTVPKLEGMETFADLERAPASQLAMQEMLSKDKYDDPNSGVSKAYRKYAGEVLRKVDENFDVSKLEGLSANSIKTLLPMGIKEDSLLLKKLKDEESKGVVAARMDDAFSKQKIKPLEDDISGKSGIFKDIENQKLASTKLITSTLGMDPDTTLTDFLRNKKKWIKIWNSPPEWGGVDAKRSADTVQALNTLLSGRGAPTKSLFEALNPKTLRLVISTAKSWAYGEPQSAGLGEYMAMFAEMALRARSVVETTKRDLLIPKIKTLDAALAKRPKYEMSRASLDSIKQQQGFENAEDEENIRELMKYPEFHNDYYSAKKHYLEEKSKLK